MSRKLKSLLKAIPDVIELKVDEGELKDILTKELVSHGVEKDDSESIAKQIAEDFVLRFSQDLYIRRTLVSEKKKILMLFEKLSAMYLDAVSQIEELTPKLEEKNADA